MKNNYQSSFHLFSIATVAVDKPKESYIIEAVCNETNHLFNGDIGHTANTQNMTSRDRNNTPIPIQSETSQVIEAEWLGLGQGGNRATAPDVYQGERVVIFRYADEDKYFWEKMYNERILRRLEHVLYMWSGHMQPPSVENDTVNSYWLLMSTLDKVVHFHTSISNGEVYEWDFKLDTEVAQFTLTDNSGILKTHDAPTASVTHDSDNREHFLTKDFFIHSKRRTLVTGPQGGMFFGPEAYRSVQYTVLKPGEYVSPVTMGNRRPPGMKMAAGQGPFKYEVRSDVYDYTQHYEEIERFNRHDFENDTVDTTNKFTIFDASGIYHEYDAITQCTNFYVNQKAYYRSQNTEFDVRQRYHVNSPTIDMGSRDMNFDTTTFNTTTDNTYEYHITKDLYITGHHNLNLNAGNGPTGNVRTESDFQERMMDGGNGNFYRDKNTATYSETEAVDNQGNFRTSKSTAGSTESYTQDSAGNKFATKSTATATETTTEDISGFKTYTKETAEYKDVEKTDNLGNIVKKKDSVQLDREERINTDGSYSLTEIRPDITTTYERDKNGNISTSWQTPTESESKKELTDGTVVKEKKNPDSYETTIEKPDGSGFGNTVGVDKLQYDIVKADESASHMLLSPNSGYIKIYGPGKMPRTVVTFDAGAFSAEAANSAVSSSVSVSPESSFIGNYYSNASFSMAGVTINGAGTTLDLRDSNASLSTGAAAIYLSPTGVSINGSTIYLNGEVNVSGKINDIDIVELNTEVEQLKLRIETLADQIANMDKGDGGVGGA